MSSDSGDSKKTPRKKGRLGKTRVALAVLLCLPLLMTLLAATTVRFAGGRILDGAAFASYAESALQSPAATDAVGSAASDKLLELIDPNRRLSEKKRDQIKDAVSLSMQTDEARSIAVRLFTSAHDEFVATAERDDLTGSETLNVDLFPLVYIGFKYLVDEKVLPYKLPDEEPGSDSAALAGAMSKSLKQKVARDAAMIKLIEQDKNGSETPFVKAHDIVGAYRNGVTASTIVAAVLFLIVVVLFVRRRIGLIVAASVTLVATIIPWFALGQVPSRVSESIDDSRGAEVARAFLEPFSADVRSRLIFVAVWALLLIVGPSLWRPLMTKVRRSG